jgi:hypothetical protein
MLWRSGSGSISRKVAGSGYDKVNSSIYLILTAALGHRVYSASNRNDYQKHKVMFLGKKVPPVRGADKFTAIREPTV